MKYHGHLMKSPYNYYFYDVNKNSIIKISKELYYFLNNGTDGLHYGILKEEIEGLQKQGYLLENPIKEICNPEIDDIEYFLNYKVSMLTLQVTQKCNFRCSYCNFTYGDNITNRSHSPVSMTWETMKEAVDFFAAHSRDKREVNIGFYGGEPLLELELIKKGIDYSQYVFRGKHLTYSMTTNGSLLTPDIAKYLIDNNVNIMVSLDGPKEIHDKNRKFFADGSGTFDSVLENLNKIYLSDPELLKKIRINSVIDPANNTKQIKDFFRHECFRESEISTPIVMPVIGSGLYFSDEYLNNTHYDNFLELLSQIDEKVKSPSSLSKNYMLDLMAFQKKLKPLQAFPERIGHSGPCKSGVLRLFVDIHGNFYPCEKASETSTNMQIGNIYEGFNIERIKEQMNIAQITKDKCKDCWCILHCSICANQADDGGRFSPELICSKCPGVKFNADSKMRDLIALSEAKDIFEAWRSETEHE